MRSKIHGNLVFKTSQAGCMWHVLSNRLKEQNKTHASKSGPISRSLVDCQSCRLHSQYRSTVSEVCQSKMKKIQSLRCIWTAGYSTMTPKNCGPDALEGSEEILQWFEYKQKNVWQEEDIRFRRRVDENGQLFAQTFSRMASFW